MFYELLWYPAAPHIRLGHYYEPQTGLALIRKDENVTRELEAALSAAKEAGEVVRKGFGWQHSIRYNHQVQG